MIVTNIISNKIIAVPFLGKFSLPAGFITYPFTFLLSDLVTELFGKKLAKQMIYLAFLMSGLSYSLIQIAIWLPGATESQHEMFSSCLGLSGWIFFSSLSAYIVSQLADIQLYAWIKRLTPDRLLWLRNNGSTLIAQLLDTFIVNTLHLYFGLHMKMPEVVSVMLFCYIYKAAFNIAMTPLFYALVFLLKSQRRNEF